MSKTLVEDLRGYCFDVEFYTYDDRLKVLYYTIPSDYNRHRKEWLFEILNYYKTIGVVVYLLERSSHLDFSFEMYRNIQYLMQDLGESYLTQKKGVKLLKSIMREALEQIISNETKAKQYQVSFNRESDTVSVTVDSKNKDR